MREIQRDAQPRPLAGLWKPSVLTAMLRPPQRFSGAPVRLVPGLVPLPNRLPDQGGINPSLGRIGSLEVRLATTKKEIKKAQRLRYRVFYEELSATPNAASMLARRDMDDFDPICDHLLVLDHGEDEGGLSGKFFEDKPFAIGPFGAKASGGKAFGSKPFGAKAFGKRGPKVVGTYRLLRQEVADRNFGFYTAGEFALQPLLDHNPGLRFLELGRSCVLKNYRNKRTVELLWQGIWTYVRHHRIDAMFGCASLDGTDPDKLALPLSFLHHHARSPEDWRVPPVPGRFVTMDRMEAEAINLKAAMHALPPLIKGYLRLGATFGEGAVVDHQFGTTDVLVMLPVSAISQRYIAHFGASAERYAA